MKASVASSPGLGTTCWKAAALALVFSVVARADNSLRNGNMAAPHGGSSSSSAATSQAATAATLATAQAAVVAANANAATQRSLQALQALQMSQAATHQSALSGLDNLGADPNHSGQQLPNVPDGLAVGGLMPLGGATLAPGSATSYNVPASWSNISGLSQTSSSAGVNDTVTQSGQQSLLYWSSFNIGKSTTLNFDQSAGGANVGQWVAINEIQNPSLSPSQILGSIQALGQIYVIDQNGIIFGGSSQVNVHSLVASSLALNPAYISNGLLNNAQNNYQFQFSALAAATTQVVSGVTTTTVAPLWVAPSAVSGVSQVIFGVPTGNVTVQAGAQLTSPTDENHDGGRITLIAPNVVNQGTISTPDGQTILAAGEQVGLTAHNASDPTLRGLDVYIGQVAAGAATLANETFTFNGLPGNSPLSTGLPGASGLTLSGTGQVGTYTPPGGSSTPLLGGATTSIPVGSVVNLTGGAASFAAVQGGTATNSANVLDGQGNIVTPGGDIEAARASVIMAGSTVNQMGIIDGSTSVTLNGRIDLLADFNSQAGTISGVTNLYPFATGTVNLGGQSVTQILPELSSGETTIGTELALSSLVNIQALQIEMLPGSLLLAPSANVPSDSSTPALDLVGATLTSGVSLDAGSWYSIGNNAGAITSVFSYNDGTILLDSGSTIDVSGSENVAASVADNIVAVQLRGPELADSTLQQDGALRGDTVYVDIRDTGVYEGTPWIGTPLGDVSGYVDDIDHTVGQLTTNGGTIALNAGGSVVTQAGSNINVSGGWINYAGAFVQTTKILSNGQIIDISEANPNLVYQGIYDGYTTASLKYGLVQNYISPLLEGKRFDPSYLQGGSGGRLSITAPSMTLAGNLTGNTVTGDYQQTPIAQLQTTYAGAAFLSVTEQIAGIPDSSTLDLSFFQLSADNVADVYQSTSPDLSFESDAYIAQNPPAAQKIFLSQDIIDSEGFGNLNIDTSAGGTITVGPGVSLTTPLDGALSFTAANIDIYGDISAPGGGTLSFTALDVPPATSLGATTPSRNPQRGNFYLAPGSTLAATGLVVDDRSVADGLPLALNGGTISIAALDVDLSEGSTLNVSGGFEVAANKAETYGSAGSISILGGEDPHVPSLVAGGGLVLGSNLFGYSGLVGGAGTLTVQAPLVQIGGATVQNGESSTSPFVQGEAGVASNGTTLWLDPAGQGGTDFFSEGGFGNITVEGLGQIETDSQGNALFTSAQDPLISPAVLVASGTTIKPVVQLAQAAINGLQIGLAPLSSSTMNELLPSQRTAANLTLSAEGVTSTLNGDGPPVVGGGTYVNTGGGGGLLVRGDLVLANGASIETDPQTNSSHGVSLLAPHGTVAVLGSVEAPGGTINIVGGSTSGLSSNKLLFYESSPDAPFPTVDLGPDSVLSTAGTILTSFNGFGYQTGTVLAGGTISISGNIVGESGALVDVAGTSGSLDEAPLARGLSIRSLTEPLYVPIEIDSNGGAVNLNAAQLLLSDATLLGGAGGPSAQGGSLAISSGFTATLDPNNAVLTPLDVTLAVSQQGANGGFSLPANYGSGLAVIDDQVPSELISVPGGPIASLFAANPNLFVSSTTDNSRSDNGGRAGGFSSLSLAGTVDFMGPVTIATQKSISVGLSSGNLTSGETGGVIYADSSVVLTAPYVALNRNESSYLPDVVAAASYPSASAGLGSLTVNAGILADVGNLSLQGIGTLDFNAYGGLIGDVRGNGTLQVAGTINMEAAQIYPPTESVFTIEADTLNISAPSGSALPALPISGGGTINLDANSITQAGVLRAPFGTINLGTNATQSLTLTPGSITSVSAVDPTTGQGIIIPYGIVDANGDWYDPQGNDITVAGNGPGGLPSKAINIVGQKIDLQSGSIIDISGGGDLYAYGFVPGTGGNQDILASLGNSLSSTSFAVVPGYGVNYAAVGTYAQNNGLLTNSVADIGYYNASLSVGEQVYLNASQGLPAGIYTLLPARYALLPNAFLITPSANRSVTHSLTQPDGSSIVSGYVTNGLNAVTAGLYTSFEVDPQSVVLARAPYTGYLADSFFPASAASQEVAVPHLPQDAGQVVFTAGVSLVLDGSLLSKPAPGGQGSQVDIASPEDIYIVGAGEAAGVPAGALVLDSSQLTDFGAGSLLVGGYRTNSASGTSVTVTTDNLVVDNAGASTDLDGTMVQGLAAPDITLVSNGALTLADGSVIEQFGQLSGPAETFTFGGGTTLGAGDGALVRVSSDSAAQIVRENVNSAQNAPSLSIGAGATIRNADGGPVGALILDSTAQFTINTSANLAPILSGNTLTLDSGAINIELGTPASAPASGLVIAQPELLSLLSSTQSLSLLSYSSIALYGSGQIGGISVDAAGNDVYQETNLALHADDIYYGDTQNSAGITINAQTVSLDNLVGGNVLPNLSGLGLSDLTVNAQTISLGSGALAMNQFATVTMNANSAILLKGLGTQVAGSDDTPTPASFSTSGNLTLGAPLITNAAADRAVTASTTSAVDEAISAGGNVVIQGPAESSGAPAGLDASLAITGGSINQTGGSIVLPSGSVNLTASSGSLVMDGTVDVGGVEESFYGLNKYTDGGQVVLVSSQGDVTLGVESFINVSAASGYGTVDSIPGNAGSLSISAPTGLFTVESAPGGLDGQAGQVATADGTVFAQGTGGTFSLDAGRLTTANLSPLETELSSITAEGGDIYSSGFDGSQSIRLRDQSILIDGLVAAQNFNISTDQGSITVSGQGRIIASAAQMGGIDTTTTLQNGVSVLANPGLTGGSISLAASGSVVLQNGSLLTAAGQSVNDAGQGGSISLAAGSDTVSGGTVEIDPTGVVSIASGAVLDLRVLQSSRTFDGSVISGTSGTLYLRAPQTLDGSGNPTGVQVNPVLGTIVDASSITVEGYQVYQASGGIIDNAEQAVYDNGTAFSAVMGTSNPQISPLFAGAVLTGPTPAINIEPGAEIINPTGDLELQNTWDLSENRFGVNNLGQALPGALTLRAAGNIEIDFGASLSDGFSDPTYQGVLLDVGSLSYSYNLISGADFSAADLERVQTLSALQTAGLGGSLLFGYQDTSAPTLLSKFSATNNDLDVFFQTIRTGTGNINIVAGDDVQLLNNLATIYTAGSQVDPTLNGTFTAPHGTDVSGNQLPATYSEGGGNVNVSAQGNIAHYQYNANGSVLLADSSDELPTNWLDREGAVNGTQVVTPTTWWVDFTNFFEGIGALGGGNVTLAAQGSVINVDAAVPTNARLVNGQSTELGGGDLVISAGDNIDGGVYYVERGQGTLTAGNNIQTNATRAAVPLGQPSTSLDWLPTTLFLGKGTFNSMAGGNLLLGPAANPFLLPQSYNNILSRNHLTNEISYFSTYAPEDAVNASSLAGTLTIQDYAAAGQGSLDAWYTNVLDSALKATSGDEISVAEPWLQLAEASNPGNVVTYYAPANNLPVGSPSNVFGGLTALLPPTLRATAYAGNIDLIGSLTLSPSATGTVDLAAEGSINGFEVNIVTVAGVTSDYYGSSVIDLSDANPAALPSPSLPISSGSLLVNLDSLFTETGATEDLTVQTRDKLHADIDGEPLHVDDPNPVDLYAVDGSISGLTAFSPKETQVIAGTDITDIGLYLQNDNADDISVVSAGRDIIAYDATSPLRIEAGDNLRGYNAEFAPLGTASGAPDSGDIQISGPGTLEVLAGRDLTLGDDDGENPNNNRAGDGLFTGLTSVGDQRNPSLPFNGGEIIAASGLSSSGSSAAGLSASSADFTAFIAQFLNPASTYSEMYLPDLAAALNMSGESNEQVWSTFQNLPVEQQDALALNLFYLVLRDAGRDHNDPTSPNFGTYAAGDKAIAALFPETGSLSGNINLTSREVASTNGGDIDVLIPGGGLTVGIENPGSQAIDQGILTVDGGNISIFAHNDVLVGSSRIFTLHGGNEIIWSSTGNIGAGASSKTVVSAPPTRVVVDPTSGNVETDLAGLATGGGIGVLASIAGVPPGDVDLIAPEGVVDAGDAGIRATGNLNIAAVQVLNASNITVGGKSTGTPTATSVNLGAITAASSAAGSSQQAASTTTPNRQNTASNTDNLPSVITVDVIGYGGADTD